MRSYEAYFHFTTKNTGVYNTMCNISPPKILIYLQSNPPKIPQTWGHAIIFPKKRIFWNIPTFFPGVFLCVEHDFDG